jgi:hypothetical protein
MNAATGKICGATLAGTILLAALAAFPAATTAGVAQPSANANLQASAARATAGTHEYAVMPTGSATIAEGSNVIGGQQITGGVMQSNRAGQWSGAIFGGNRTLVLAESVSLTPSTIRGDFTTVSQNGQTLYGGGRLAGHRDSLGDLVYSGTLYFGTQSLTITNLTLNPTDSANTMRSTT